MILDVSSAMDRLLRDVWIKTVLSTQVDFVQQNTTISRCQPGVIQVADKDKLNAGTIDWSLKYIIVNSRANISIGEYVDFNGDLYKIISRENDDGYGFYEVIGEQFKGTLT